MSNRESGQNRTLSERESERDKFRTKEYTSPSIQIGEGHVGSDDELLYCMEPHFEETKEFLCEEDQFDFLGVALTVLESREPTRCALALVVNEDVVLRASLMQALGPTVVHLEL